MNNTLIKANKVSFSYDTSQAPVILDVDLSIYEQDYLVLMGPNGGGKTTLLKLLLGLYKPGSGSIEYNNVKPIQFGYVPQFSTYDRNIPIMVNDFIAMGRIQFSRPFKRLAHIFDNEIKEQLNHFNLAHLANSSINDLSGGELQRVLLARAMIQDPKILFLDEPTTYIDSESRGQLTDMLSKLNKRVAIVMITHDTSVVNDSVKHIACVNQKLYYHQSDDALDSSFEKVYGCPIELLTHGKSPHRVLKEHR